MNFVCHKYKVLAELRITRRELGIIEPCSDQHYDEVCRSASKQGGFIYGWLNRLEFDEKDEVEVVVDFRTVDTLAKILEQASLVHQGDKEDLLEAEKLHMLCRDILLGLYEETERVNKTRPT